MMIGEHNATQCGLPLLKPSLDAGAVIALNYHSAREGTK